VLIAGITKPNFSKLFCCANAKVVSPQRIYTVSSAGAGHAYLNKLSDDQSWRYEKIEILSFPNLAITLVLLTTQSQNVIRRK